MNYICWTLQHLIIFCLYLELLRWWNKCGITIFITLFNIEGVHKPYELCYYSLMREVCVKNVNCARAWNTFGQVVTMSQDIRHNRFCLRLALKYPNNLALGVLNGNTAMVAGSYKHALGQYFYLIQKTVILLLLKLLFLLNCC